jgi:hypothetical protein
VAPRKPGSALGRNWYDSRAHKRPRGDWIPALLISCGIFGGGNKSRVFDPLVKFIVPCSYIRLSKLSDRRDCLDAADRSIIGKPC